MSPPGGDTPATHGPIWAFVALGSNLGESPRIVSQAMDELRRFSSRPLLRSSLWASEPVDCPPGSPVFINAAAGLVPFPDVTPESLLTDLQALEERFGRPQKRVLNEARPLDLDLIAFGARRQTSSTLILPHPRAHFRRFVLEPLCEIAPDLVLPGQARSVRELLSRLNASEDVRKFIS